jgi:hypothetical protein
MVARRYFELSFSNVPFLTYLYGFLAGMLASCLTALYIITTNKLIWA